MKLKLKEILDNNSNNRILMGAMLLILGCFLLINISAGDTYAVDTGGYYCNTGTLGTYAPTELVGIEMRSMDPSPNFCLTLVDTKTCYVVSNGVTALNENCSQYNYDYRCTYVDDVIYNPTWKKCTRGDDVSYCNINNSGCVSYENSGYSCEWVKANKYTCNKYTYTVAEYSPSLSNVCYQCNTNPNMLYWAKNKDHIPNDIDDDCGSDWHEYNASEQNCSSNTIKYNLNDETGSFNTQYKAKGATVKLYDNIPVREGYIFKGWSIYEDVESVEYMPGDSFSGNYNLDLYAVWSGVGCYLCAPSGQEGMYDWGLVSDYGNSPFCTYINGVSDEASCLKKNNVYTIVYDANGGTGTTASSTHTYDVAKKLTKNGFSKEDHDFIGWSTTSGGSVKYTDEQSVTNLASANGAKVTLYAVWKQKSGGGTVTPTPVTYTVSYDANGGTGTTASSTHTYDVAKKLTKNGFSREDYDFIGWSKTSTGSVEYTDEQSVTNLTSTNGATVKLYAVWKKKTDDGGDTPGDTPEEDKIYNIKYILNGGTGTNNPDSAKYDEVVTINNPSKTVTVTGNANKTDATIGSPINVNLDFAGWTSSDLDTKTAYYGNTAWKDGKTKVTATTFKNLTGDGKTVTLEANWNSKEINLPTISKEGYSCVWNTKVDGTGDKYYSGAKYTISGNVSSVNLYAVCEINSKADEEIEKGPTTGDVLIYIVWGIGLGALGYSIYYFRKKKFDV